MIEPALVCAVALLLDQVLGEPRRWHPVVGFGTLASRLEWRLNRNPGAGFWRGLLAVTVLIVPLTLIAWLMVCLAPSWLVPVLEAVGLWLALSLRGLREHGLAVVAPLERHDLDGARQAVGGIVSRNARRLDEQGVATAATESMLENGADAVFASLFWFLLAGLPGVVLHRMVNTLDAMWGYRNERFLTFGRVAARLDDVMNWVPARLTALTYALLGDTRQALRCWRTQAGAWESPNAGPVMAAGAGALNITLGGPAPYGDRLRPRPILGAGRAATAGSIRGALALVTRGAWLWVALLGFGAMMFTGGNG
ncbi:adenosylcobinamide-phosphate synthase CbiB [Marinobacter sp. M1N3S26]|uniref:adenosylcobinamide-phosphate synthase CbiB n=1 Tax=unclassified Marinobacter TaxID=83889 RepID=UPI00387AD21B